MTWTLQTGKIKLEIVAKATLGREDFPDDKKISKEHVEVFVVENRLFARDLGSSNGTFLRGKRLENNATAELLKDDIMQIGATPLTVHFSTGKVAGAVVKKKKVAHIQVSDSGEIVSGKDAPAADADDELASDDDVFPKIAAAVYAVLVIVCFSNPTIAFGKSVGLGFSLLLAGVLLLATALVALPLAAVFMRVQNSFRRNFTFAMAVAILGSFAYSFILNAIDEQYPFTNRVIAAKVEYFCLKHFDRPRCVQQVNSCPACVVAIEKWARDKMVENLKPARSQYPAAIQAEVRAEQNPRKPAEATP